MKHNYVSHIIESIEGGSINEAITELGNMLALLQSG